MPRVFDRARRAGFRCLTNALLLAAFLIAPRAGVAEDPATLLVLGDSLSSAFNMKVEEGWVNLLQTRLDERSERPWRVVNAAISGDTTDGGRRRLPDLLESHRPDVVVLELGGNDGLRGFAPDVTEANLAAMIEASQAIGAKVLLVGIELPPNYGARYTEAFRSIFPTLAARYDTALVPFFMEGVFETEDFLQADGIHPTAKAQPKLLETVWPHLAPLVGIEDETGRGSD